MSGLRYRLAAGLFCMLLLGGATAVGALEVRVQGEAFIEAHSIAAGTTLRVEGLLRDDVGEGVPVQRLELLVGKDGEIVVEERLTTGYRGEFSFFTELAPGSYDVEVRFPGGSHFGPVQAREQVELSVLPIRMRLSGPAWVLVPETSAPIIVRALTGEVGLPGYVTVIVNDRPVASIELENDGSGEYDVGPYLRGGENTVRVRLDGTRFREPVMRSVTIRRAEGVRLRGEVEPVFRRLSRGLEVELIVDDEYGPLAGAEVEFTLHPVDEADGLVELATTDERGRGRAFFSYDDMGDGLFDVSATVRPPLGAPLNWEGPTVRKQVPAWTTVVEWLALLAMLGGFIWLGRRALIAMWEAAKGYLERRRMQRDRQQEQVDVLASVERVGLKPLAVSRTTQETVAETRLVIWDVWRGEAIGGASVAARAEEGVEAPVTLLSDADGVISLKQLPPGTWTLRAEARGFLSAETSLTLPATGHFRLPMTAIPLKIRRLYRWCVEEVQGADRWGQLTPREIEGVLRPLVDEERSPGAGDGQPWELLLRNWEELPEERRGAALLEAITNLVEETNFSGRTYDRETWEAARGAIKELLRALSAGEEVDGHV